jgi:hypothetical protein
MPWEQISFPVRPRPETSLVDLKTLFFYGKEYRKIDLVGQRKKKHNISCIRLDCGSEVLQEYRVKYDRALKSRNLLELDDILA